MRLLILDRDGVINEESDTFIKSPEEWIPIPGSLEAIAKANKLGYRVVVVTNQSGLARGQLDIGALHLIHQKMHQWLYQAGGTVEAIFFCPHGPEDDCECRKPKTGLFAELAARLRVPLEDVYAVGDRMSDLEAARKAGARPILVRTGHGDRTVKTANDLNGVPVYRDLAAVVDRLLVDTRP